MKIHEFDCFCRQSSNKNLLDKTNRINLNSVLDFFSKKISLPSWICIKNWHFFEHGNKEYSMQEVIEIFEVQNLFKNIDSCYLVTIESYTKNIIFELNKVDDFIYLVDNYHSIINDNIEFMQPMDYILLNKDFSKSVLIHHDGYKMIIHN